MLPFSEIRTEVLGSSVKAPLKNTPLNSLFLDTLQEVELFGFLSLSMVQLEGI